MMTIKSIAKRIGAITIAIQIILSSAGPGFAQRRREEPVANPEFKGTQASQAPEAGPLGVPTDEGPPPGGGRPTAGGIQIGAAAPSKAAPASPLNPLETRVTVRVKGAPLATFLDTISAQSKVNFIITEGLETKQITAFLQNVTVREALQILLEIKGLTYQQIGKSNTFVIAPRSKAAEPVITRIYTLAYVPLIGLGSIESEQAAITPTTNVSALASGGAVAPSSGGEVSIVTVIRSVLSKTNGMIALEPRTNSIIVTDIPESFPQVEQIILELDKKTPQVMIEAQIVEINSDRARELGFEWGGAGGELASFTAGKRDVSFPLNLPTKVGNTHFFDPFTLGTVSQAEGGEAAGGATSVSAQTDVAIPVTVPSPGALTNGIFDLTSLKVVLRALVSRSEARFLGKPKVLTLNNKPAIIQIARNAAMSTQQQSASSASGLGTASVTVERILTGLILKVTPQINKEGYITMLVQPSFTDAQESVISSTAKRIFDSVTRGASTLVRVKNGQTLVLGGLLQSTENKVVRKVPFLGYIPLIGWLFTSSSTRRRNSDLVIFITPTIVND